LRNVGRGVGFEFCEVVNFSLYVQNFGGVFDVNSSFFDTSETPAFFHQRRCSTADASGLPEYAHLEHGLKPPLFGTPSEVSKTVKSGEV
jgi:hypothetical protein